MYIKTLIDPKESNQIYKNAFLLFVNNYWEAPGNRDRLFKMKINLTGLPRDRNINEASPQKIVVKCRYNQS